MTTTISYTNIITRYRGDEFLDNVSHQVRFGGQHQLSPRTQWTAFYSASLAVIERDDTVIFHRTGVGVGRQVNPTITVNAGLGVAFVQDESPRLTLNTGISKNFKTGSLSLQYVDGVGAVGGLSTNATRRQNIVGQARRTIGQNASIYVQSGYGNNRSLSGQEVKISTYTAGGGINLRFLSWLSGGLGYSYLNQKSEGSRGNNGERNAVFVSLTASAPSWRVVR